MKQIIIGIPIRWIKIVGVVVTILILGTVVFIPRFSQPPIPHVSDEEKHADLFNKSERDAFCIHKGYQNSPRAVGKDSSYYPPDAWKTIGTTNLPWQDTDPHVECYNDTKYWFNQYGYYSYDTYKRWLIENQSKR